MAAPIRPTEAARSPESLAGAVAPDAVRFYALIRDWMPASQMAEARSEWLEIVLATPGGKVTLAAPGTRLVFRQADGHSRDGSRRLTLGETREEV